MRPPIEWYTDRIKDLEKQGRFEEAAELENELNEVLEVEALEQGGIDHVI